MADLASTGGKLESKRELEKTPEDVRAVWDRELEAARKHYEKFHQTSEKILLRYRDERKSEITSPAARLNIFWSNVQVLKSTLYTRPPKVDVSRIFKDYIDDVARVAGIIMERLLNHDLEKDTSDFDVAVRQAIDDWLIVAQGQVWYRYDVTTEQVLEDLTADQMGGAATEQSSVGEGLETEAEAPQERITSEDALSDYIYWRDFLCSPSRTWAESRWVARRVYMTRDSLVDRFGEDIGERVPLKSRNSTYEKTYDAGNDDANDDPWATAEVWEIWCKTNRRVYWVVKGFDEFLDMREDPLQLEGFYPCPQPMLANQTNNTLIPRADFSMARDQYSQIDVLVARLRLLIDACKVRGVYDKESAPVLANILQGNENKMVPVDSWALFAEKGGLKGVVDWVPVDMIVTVIAQLRQDMADQKQELYETLGIADIMRGATRASETATAQQIKAQFGSVRLQFKQFEVARFVRDAQRIKAEIICKHFQPETMLTRSNIMETPDAKFAEAAIALLKQHGVMQYRLNIEADSMAALDWANERDSRTQFMAAIGSFIQQTLPLAQTKPESVPFLLQLMQWGLGGFRVGKEIEGVLDQAVQAMSNTPPGPTPEQKAMQQAQLEKTQTEAAKNKTAAARDIADAAKTASETHGQALQNYSDQQIASHMSPAPGEIPLTGANEYQVQPGVRQ